MKGLLELLVEEQKRLETIIMKVKNRLKDAPTGTLRLSKSHHQLQYYRCTKEKKTGIYINKKNIGIARQLAQKTYDEKVLKLAEKRLSQIYKITKDYEENEIEELFFKERVERQELIEPVEPTWEQKMKEWKTREYKGKGFRDDTPIILTERGERVRSKSEKILADYFYRNGIEYKYECPLYLNGIGTIYPDFTFLSSKTGEEMYWEHNGKVDDPVYARNMVKKILAYESNGIFQGEKLILTFETEQTILNSSKIEQLVKHYL
ncbi:MAG: hypothetical protein IJC02_00335 [Lachnospiraceae bacterium]|nr:hypothetical protein [Lachnospiraceae bacterium]